MYVYGTGAPMIRSFACDRTRNLHRGHDVSGFDPRVEPAALRRLQQLDQAQSPFDMRVPPGNRLEKLSGDRAGFFSVRVNDQWRFVFRWTEAGPAEVALVDYH